MAQWPQDYAGRTVSSADAIGRIQPGDRVFLHTGCANPTELVAELTNQHRRLYDIEMFCLLTVGPAPYLAEGVRDRFHMNAFFVTDTIRDAVQAGRADYIPTFISEIPALFEGGRIAVDAALIQVSPPDDAGYCSLGVSVDVVRSAIENARLIIAEVNPAMPRAMGDSFVHIDEIDLLVPVDHELVCVEPPEPDPITERIAYFIAELVEDGSTLELGIGRIPHATLRYLDGKRDLGIHTEMFTDGLIDLVERGVITGARKQLNPGKAVASFCMGTRRLYDYIDGNEAFEFRTSQYVNDPEVIAKHERMVAINTALEVDLTGQVCADSVGPRFYSGFGGQIDFVRGASRARDGKAIIALPSTARDGQVSRIVATLTPGSGVVTSRGDVHYVVTEYGIAYLHGKTIHQRAMALMNIAHPKFRADLLRQAKELNFVYSEVKELPWEEIVYPRDLETTMTMNDGTEMVLRPVKPTDEEDIKDLFYSLTEQSRYYRFFSIIKTLPRAKRQDMIAIDYKNELAIVASVQDMGAERIIGIGRYFVDPGKDRAEVSFMVHQQWQDRGVGTRLLRYLVDVAKRTGIKSVYASVLAGNRAMLNVFNASGYDVTASLDGDTYEIHFPIDDKAERQPAA